MKEYVDELPAWVSNTLRYSRVNSYDSTPVGFHLFLSNFRLGNLRSKTWLLCKMVVVNTTTALASASKCTMCHMLRHMNRPDIYRR